MATIQQVNPSTLQMRHICTGSIISRDFLLTSASCVDNFTNSILEVQISHNSKYSQVMPTSENLHLVTTILINPSWLQSFEHDLAMIRVQPLFNDKVSIASLPPKDFKLMPKTECRMAGWALYSKEFLHPASPILLETLATVKWRDLTERNIIWTLPDPEIATQIPSIVNNYNNLYMPKNHIKSRSFSIRVILVVLYCALLRLKST